MRALAVSPDQLAFPFPPDAPLPARLMPRRPARIRVRGPTPLTFLGLLERQTIAYRKRLTRAERAEMALWGPLEPLPTWDECKAQGLGLRTPCPHFRCRHHMGLERTAKRTVKLLWGHVELEDYPATCSIVDAALTNGHGMSVDRVAQRTGLPKRTVERALANAMSKLRDLGIDIIDPDE